MTATAMNKIEKQIVIRAPRERVWRAITNIAEFSKWFQVESKDAFAPGARVHMISTHESCPGESFYVFVEEMDAPCKFSWRWHPGRKEAGVDYHDEPTTLVVFLLEEAQGGTLLTITESGFDQISLTRRAAVLKQNTGGWEFMVKQIASYVGQAA